MANCPLYNGQNLDFTGNKNPYSLIQKAGKRKTRRSRKSMRKRGKGKNMKKTRKSRK
jgi:hypothetical protein